ncbi:histidyl-tRNA synthetase [Methanococcus vannielii SB]|jgi:histidyl-tRNA synthetase|uniref:Histidine--tRNA ligase n=1 Tax=Methanococcus vannielii (strain ATCC 35089 / DSM 1224 / JCM 13029 / OCM 148 / SB) TaxID=406327 RepID=SYH_METVS|nr:histidine--tRNA ligase [Methanococcus vannielii]A6UQQ6.1 RecName: Full=Histidine--tRNA ligase; AltName: Full=Histidyl-tRNA synthetase; Short=HisRS [Methanococcus vannielii SB]ABR54828.1 histidyl-tRNA synthetase [Methanococcus vannielii SB]
MFQKPKGTRDFLPVEMKKRKLIEKKLRNIFDSYNFSEINTPTFESFELLSKKTGEEIRNQLFVFNDHGNREMGLRPEFTSSVARFYINEFKNTPKPVKMYYFGNCFRYENPQAGRYREFWQMGAELIGSNKSISDAEVLNMAIEGLKSINMDFEINIGHLGVLKGVFEKYSLSEEDETLIRRLIDKEDTEGLKQVLLKIEEEKNIEISKKVFEVLTLKGGKEVISKLKEKLTDFEKSLDALNNLDEILELVPHDYVVNFGIARGLDYYTGMVFEIYGKKEGARQVCGGGRYDNLIELFEGEKSPAVGFAYGFDRIILNIDDFEVQDDSIFIIPVKNDIFLLKECLKIAKTLRDFGNPVEIDLMGRKLNKALNYANSKNIKRVIIIGENDIFSGKIPLKNMETGEQVLIDVKDLKNFPC